MAQGFIRPNAVTDVAMSFADSNVLDAFGRLRVSQPRTLFASPLTYGLSPIQWEASSTDDGIDPVHNADTRMVKLQIDAGATGGTSYMITRQYHAYRPGKSQRIFITGILGTATAGAVKRFGYGDDNNGIFFEQNGTSGLQVNRRTKTSGSVVNNTVAQSSWNLDKLDGTGASGITLDVTKDFLLEIDFQWLGMGRIRIGFDIDGQLIYCHEFLIANVIAVPSFQSATLPVLAEIVAAAGLAGTATAQLKCAEVSSEGGQEEAIGYPFAAEGTVTAASGARTHVLSLRPKTTFNSIPNRSLSQLESIEILGGTNQVLWEICFGVAYSAGPTWADANTTYSAFEVGTGGTYSNLTNGFVAQSGYVQGGSAAGRSNIVSDIANRVPISLNRAGANTDLGTLSILLTAFTGTSVCRVVLNWKELR